MLMQGFQVALFSWSKCKWKLLKIIGLCLALHLVPSIYFFFKLLLRFAEKMNVFHHPFVPHPRTLQINYFLSSCTATRKGES